MFQEKLDLSSSVFIVKLSAVQTFITDQNPGDSQMY